MHSTVITYVWVGLLYVQYLQYMVCVCSVSVGVCSVHTVFTVQRVSCTCNIFVQGVCSKPMVCTNVHVVCAVWYLTHTRTCPHVKSDLP